MNGLITAARLKSGTYSPEAAYWMARASSLAYDAPESSRERLREWGFDDFTFFDASGTQSYIARNGSQAIIAFRGTQPTELRDLLADADVRPVRHPVVGGVHGGFWGALGPVLVNMARVLNEYPVEVFLTGHSLGAALATLFATTITNHKIGGIYTYGSPRVGDGAFADFYGDLWGDVTYRHRNNNDAITRLPLALPAWLTRTVKWWTRLPYVPGGYRHVGNLKYFDVEGRLHEDVSPWFRFLDAVDGRMEHLFKVGTDGFADHSVSTYVRLCRNNWRWGRR